MDLYRVTLTYPAGRKLFHHAYAVIAPDAHGAKTKLLAYLGHRADSYTEITAEIDEDGVISGGLYVTRQPAKGAK